MSVLNHKLCGLSLGFRANAGRPFLFLVVALTLALALLGPPAEFAQAQDEAKGPKITAGPAISSSPASGDTYRAGEKITVALTFSEPVSVTGKPRLRLRIGEQRRWAGYESASEDGATLSFSHAVKPDDHDADGIGVVKNSLKLNGGTIDKHNRVNLTLAIPTENFLSIAGPEPSTVWT